MQALTSYSELNIQLLRGNTKYLENRKFVFSPYIFSVKPVIERDNKCSVSNMRLLIRAGTKCTCFDKKKKGTCTNHST